MLLAQIRNHWDKGKEAAVTKAKSEDVFEIIGAVFPYPEQGVGEGMGTRTQHCSLPSAVCRLPMVHMKYELRKLMTNISTFIA